MEKNFWTTQDDDRNVANSRLGHIPVLFPFACGKFPHLRLSLNSSALKSSGYCLLYLPKGTKNKNVQEHRLGCVPKDTECESAHQKAYYWTFFHKE